MGSEMCIRDRSSRAALEHKKSLGQRKIGHNAHASTKGAGAFYAIADNAAVWKPAFTCNECNFIFGLV